MLFYLVDDSPGILNVLRIIIQDRNLGQICGTAVSPADALEDLRHMRPDIIVVDLLMPAMDGISFVKKAKELLSDTVYIMLSQVSSKDMIADAYESGIEFFIQKPVNSIEVESVFRKVIRTLNMTRTFRQMQTLVGAMPVPSQPAPKHRDHSQEEVRRRTEDLLRRIGILGESGSRDIVSIVCHIAEHSEDGSLALGQLCALVGDSPKTVEQRIRRAAYAGLVSLANLGIEDYANEIFAEYAGSLYQFEQVRREMDYIRGKGTRHGKVQIRTFISALVSYSTRKYH